ncbi:Serine/threonine-protein kinase PknD [Planctomycetes bacterium Pan216]|uniref:Serine/threonine-protein kinase PknD n=1 Tax=Kolteria novifilia TaxID=2527975 RepID=A0A518B457_9BACT|nr:Serine/threonine-protein kinase PknD [Planctomycetes bacterium Pan216]
MIGFDELFLTYVAATEREVWGDILGAIQRLPTPTPGEGSVRQALVNFGVLTAERLGKLEEQLGAMLDEIDWNPKTALRTLRERLEPGDRRILQRWFPETSSLEEVPEHRTQFVMDSLYARGGLGEVWRVRESGTGRMVLLKRMRQELVSDPILVKRFLREARMTARLEHPSVVPVYHVPDEATDEGPFYVMQHLHGRTLEASIAQLHVSEMSGSDRRVMLRDLLRRFLSVCEAVAFANSQGIVHRDIKPENIICGEFGSTYLIDWGLIKLVERGEETAALPSPSPMVKGATVAGERVGTPEWMAPEQASGGDVDIRTDVYGLGATLFTILTGGPPHQTAPILVATYRRIVDEPTPRPQDRKSSVSPTLDAICAKAMAKRPEDRYPSVKEMVRDLERWEVGEPVSCHKESLSRRLARGLMNRPSRSIVLGGVILISMCCTLLIAAAWSVSSSLTKKMTRKLMDEKSNSIAAILDSEFQRVRVDVLFLSRLGDTVAALSDPEGVSGSEDDLSYLKAFLQMRPSFEKVRILFPPGVSKSYLEVKRVGHEKFEVKRRGDPMEMLTRIAELRDSEANEVVLLSRLEEPGAGHHLQSQVVLGTKVTEDKRVIGYLLVNVSLPPLFDHAVGQHQFASIGFVNSVGEQLWWSPASSEADDQPSWHDVDTLVGPAAFAKDHAPGMLIEDDGLHVTGVRFLDATLGKNTAKLAVVISANLWDLPHGPREFVLTLLYYTVAIIVPIILVGAFLRLLLVQVALDD